MAAIAATVVALLGLLLGVLVLLFDSNEVLDGQDWRTPKGHDLGALMQEKQQDTKHSCSLTLGNGQRQTGDVCPWRQQRPRLEPPGAFRLIWWTMPIGIYESVRTNLGLRSYADLIRHIWHALTFDWRYGVRTGFLVPSADLDIPDSEKQRLRPQRYRATPPLSVSLSLSRLKERLGGLGGHTMVDYGSGAGRVMILGAEAGLGRVIGVELSPNLVRQSVDNLKRYSASSGTSCAFDALNEDASLYEPPSEATVFYFFKPFQEDVFRLVLNRIWTSVQRKPRTIWILLLQTYGRYDTSELHLVGSVAGVDTYSNCLCAHVESEAEARGRGPGRGRSP